MSSMLLIGSAAVKQSTSFNPSTLSPSLMSSYVMNHRTSWVETKIPLYILYNTYLYYEANHRHQSAPTDKKKHLL
jgi:hypothetical protein